MPFRIDGKRCSRGRVESEPVSQEDAPSWGATDLYMTACGNLKWLDGLNVDRGEVIAEEIILIVERRDGIETSGEGRRSRR